MNKIVLDPHFFIDLSAREHKVKVVNGIRYELKAIRPSSSSCYIDWVPVGGKRNE